MRGNVSTPWPNASQQDEYLAVFLAAESRLPVWVELVLTAVTSVCTVLGNAVLLSLVLTVKSLRRRPHVFVASLAMCNILYGIQQFFTFAVRFADEFWVPHWLCQIDGIVIVSSVIGGSFSLAGIALNRYSKICHNHTYMWWFSTPKIVCMLMCMCAGSLGLGLLPMRPGWQYIFDDRISCCLFDRATDMVSLSLIMIFGMIIPGCVVFVCHWRMYAVVNKSKQRVEQRQTGTGKQQQAGNKASLTLARTGGVLFLSFLLFWVPLSIVTFIGLLTHVDHILHMIGAYILNMSPCINPIIYGALNQNFRAQYRLIFLKSARRVFSSHPEQHHTSNQTHVTQICTNTF